MNAPDTNGAAASALARGIHEGDALLACRLVGQPGVDIAAPQAVVLKHGSADEIARFAYELPPGKGDIQALEDALLQRSDNREAIVLFATYATGANIEKLATALQGHRSPMDMRQFLASVRDIPSDTRASMHQAIADMEATVAERQQERAHFVEVDRQQQNGMSL